MKFCGIDLHSNNSVVVITEALALFMIGMLNPFLYIFLGVMRSPGLLTALVLMVTCSSG